MVLLAAACSGSARTSVAEQHAPRPAVETRAPGDSAPRTEDAEAASGARRQDSDGDEIEDARDDCPTHAESYNGFKDDDGCPDPHPTLELLGVILFKELSAELDRQDDWILEGYVELLATRPHLTLEVGGYADAGKEYKVRRVLSLRRAKAVKAWLVRKGVAPRRLTVEGYGGDCPVALESDSQTEMELRAKSRRITFLVVDSHEVSTDELRRCP